MSRCEADHGRPSGKSRRWSRTSRSVPQASLKTRTSAPRHLGTSAQASSLKPLSHARKSRAICATDTQRPALTALTRLVIYPMPSPCVSYVHVPQRHSLHSVHSSANVPPCRCVRAHNPSRRRPRRPIERPSARHKARRLRVNLLGRRSRPSLKRGGAAERLSHHDRGRRRWSRHARRHLHAHVLDRWLSVRRGLSPIFRHRPHCSSHRMHGYAKGRAALQGRLRALSRAS